MTASNSDPRRIRIVVAMILATLTGLVASPHAHGENLLTLPVRYMTIQSEVIVVAEPSPSDDQAVPTSLPKFKVQEVLKGDPGLANETIEVKSSSITFQLPHELLIGQKQKNALERAKVVKVILFLKRSKRDGDTPYYYTVASGIRAVNSESVVLVPRQMLNPGPQDLLPKDGVKWDDIVTQVRDDLPKIAEIRKLREIADPAERNDAIFDWIEKHRNEFRRGFPTDGKQGWFGLEQEVFNWIMESGREEDCWKAVVIGAQVGSGPNRHYDVFSTARGIRLLLDNLQDEKQSEALRLTALRTLGGTTEYWNAYQDGEHDRPIVRTAEQQKVIEAVLPFLQHDDPAWRMATVRCLRAISRPDDASFGNHYPRPALPTLAIRFHTERNTEVLREIVDAIRHLEDEEYWEALSGNPNGIVAELSCAGVCQGSGKTGHE